MKNKLGDWSQSETHNNYDYDYDPIKRDSDYLIIAVMSDCDYLDNDDNVDFLFYLTKGVFSWPYIQ